MSFESFDGTKKSEGSSAPEIKKAREKKSNQAQEIIKKAREGPHEPFGQAQKIINEARSGPKEPLSQAQRIIHEARGQSVSTPEQKTAKESGEMPEKKIPAKRMKELRAFVEAAREAEVNPREFIEEAAKEKMKETGAGSGYQNVPESFKKMEKVLFLGHPEKTRASMKYYYTYNFEMGRKLIKAGCIAPKDKNEDAATTFLRAMKEPESILDEKKFKEVLENAEKEFFAINEAPVDIRELITQLKKIKKEKL